MPGCLDVFKGKIDVSRARDLVVGLAVLGNMFVLMILKVFSSLNDSIILWLYPTGHSFFTHSDPLFCPHAFVSFDVGKFDVCFHFCSSFFFLITSDFFHTCSQLYCILAIYISHKKDACRNI